MKYTCGIFSIVIFLTTLLISCEKQAPPCTGNCAEINANGKIINKLDGTIAPTVPVELSWITFVGGFSKSEVIVTVNSKPDGSFNFTTNIDTSFFSKGYFLSLSVGSCSNYMILGYSGVIGTRMYTFDTTAFQNIQFEVYPKAILKLTLQRTLTDSFQSYSISHSNVNNIFYIYDYNIGSQNEITGSKTKVINVETVANVYTKIRIEKDFANGTSFKTLDSIKCFSNSTNNYIVSY